MSADPKDLDNKVLMFVRRTEASLPTGSDSPIFGGGNDGGSGMDDFVRKTDLADALAPIHAMIQGLSGQVARGQTETTDRLKSMDAKLDRLLDRKGEQPS